MAGPNKNLSRREREKPRGPPSSSAQSSSGQSTASSAHQSVKTQSSAAKTIISAQYDGGKDSSAAPVSVPQMIGMRNLESIGMDMWRGYLGVSFNHHQPSSILLDLFHHHRHACRASSLFEFLVVQVFGWRSVYASFRSHTAHSLSQSWCNLDIRPLRRVIQTWHRAPHSLVSAYTAITYLLHLSSVHVHCTMKQPADAIMSATPRASTQTNRHYRNYDILTHKKVKSKTPLPKRNGKFNTLGREITLNLNTFDIISPPTKNVQQYDITIVSDKGAPTRVVQMKVWKSKAVQQALGKGSWLFDSNKLAWYVEQFPTVRLCNADDCQVY
jgi:hypothetical protein